MTFFSRLLSLFVAVSLLGVVPASAAPSASDYIQTLGNQALAVIANKSFDKAQKQTKLEKLFSDSVDFPWVGRFVMGRYWREATTEQKSSYAAAYKKFLILHYTSRFTNFTSGTFKVTGEKDDGDGEFTVSMQMKADDPGSEPVSVDYRVRNEGGKFKIFDVIVEGVGLLTTQRSEFSSVIATNGIDYLVEQLEVKSQKAE